MATTPPTHTEPGVPDLPEIIVPGVTSTVATPKLIIRVKKDYSELTADRLIEGADPDRSESEAESVGPLPGVWRALADYGRPPHGRAITSVDAETLWSMENDATPAERFSDYASLTRFWRIDVSGLGEDATRLRDRLASIVDEVDWVYFETPSREASPLVDPDTDLPYGKAPAAPSGDPGEYQKYLEPRPVGVNARAAWELTDGAGVGFAEIEQQWYDDHEDLNVPASGLVPEVKLKDAIPLVAGVNRMSTRRVNNFTGFHGTAVLGIVLARDNDKGCIGLAPNARKAVRLSYWEVDAANNFVETSIADLILDAARNHLTVGDVLLLEVEKFDGTNHYPVEYLSLERQAIKLAVSIGIVVVEPAGNGGLDLATVEDPALPGKDILNPDSDHYDDSGAIMVACSKVTDAASPGEFHPVRGTNTNYGARVNCFAWGDSVRTCGASVPPVAPLPLQDPAGYGLFADSSAAAAIIAGAAILAQSALLAANGTVSSPMELRALLSEPSLGTDKRTLSIGVMPDLGLVLSSVGLGLLPDVYIRDNLTDTGAVPSAGSISSSPDIIVRQAAVADPTAEFGGDNANLGGFSQEVLAARDHWIYVRMKNRGAVDSTATRATVYWSPTSTLVTPDLWHRIEETPAKVVPTGGAVVVSDGIQWYAADVPAKGHYCFVAVLNDPKDLKPPLWNQTTGLVPVWEDFVRLVRDQNNVAWCNFNVVDATSFVRSQDWLDVLIPGAFDAEREFSFELLSRLPLGTRIWLELPLALAGRARLPHAWGRVLDKTKLRVRVMVPNLRRVSLGTFHLPKAARYQVRVGIHAPPSLLKTACALAIRQIYEGQEVGRVTWQFTPPTCRS